LVFASFGHRVNALHALLFAPSSSTVSANLIMVIFCRNFFAPATAQRGGVRQKLAAVLIGMLLSLTWTPSSPAGEPLETWTLYDSGVTNFLQNAVFANGLFVAVGYEGSIVTSVDGTNWSAQNSGTLDSLYTITHGAGLFVAAGNRGALTVSEDGYTWTPINSGTANPLFGSTYGDGKWVVAGGSNILVSVNGFQWVNQRSPFLPQAFLNTIAYGAGRFVGVGAGGYAVWSTNGLDWARSDSPLGNHFSMIYAGGQFLATGGGFVGFSETATSPDGVVWTSQALASFVSLIDVQYGNGRYLAAGLFLTFPPPDGLEFLFESTDGLEWTLRSLPAPRPIVGLTYAHGRFYGVGAGGIILESGSYAPGYFQPLSPPGSNGMELRIIGEIGRTYRLQTSPEIDGTNWQDLLIFTNPSAAETSVTDPRAGRLPRRFYRLLSPSP
jgi:hypothetical protein